VRPLHPAASANPFVRVRAALAEIAAGGPVVVVDDEDQENGGDLVFAAELAVPEPVAAAVGDADTGDTAGEFQGDDAPG
jgi:3,4-dihydroxy 2-butanone 4-phosphate synthase / GTP cyclohydrolase II